MTSFMDSIYAGKDRFVQDQERKRQETTRKLFGEALQNKPDALTQLYGVDPATALKAKEQTQTMQKESAQLAWQAASAMHNAAPEQKATTYASIHAEMMKHPELGAWVKDLPAQYDPATVDPIVQGIIAQTGIYQDQPKAGSAPALLQSFDGMATRMGLKPGSPEYQQAARVWANLDPKAKAQIVESADGYNVATYGGGAPAVSDPLMSGGSRLPAPMAPPRAPAGAGIATDAGMGVQPTAQDVQSNPGVTWDNGEFNSLSPIEKAKFNSYVSRSVPFQIVGGKVIAGQSGGTQLRPAPKAGGSYQQLSAQEVQSLGLPKGTVAQRSADGKVDIISKPDAPDQMTELQRYKQDQANTEKGKRMGAATASIDETLSRIDELEKHPGFTDLGTAYGDLATGVPLIRTDAKGAQAKLEAVKGQIALATMAELKTLSSSGATGFGALSEKELALLQGSIDNLTTSVSFADLKANLANVKKRLQAMKAGIGKESVAPSAPSAPAKPATGKKDYSGLF